VDERELLTHRFEEKRSHLRAVAYRMLGSVEAADDAVQEAWLRLSRSGTDGVENLGGWLTTVVARVCLDVLRTRKARPEEPLDVDGFEPSASRDGGIDPEQETLLADSVGLALLVVLDTLAPPERIAFVLHDLFNVPFDEIAPIVGRSATAARQLASRARRRVQGADVVGETDRALQREIVAAFLAAARGGDFNALLALLDPDAVIVADPTAVGLGAEPEVRGAAAVAGVFSKRARTARPALVDGLSGLVWAPGGRLRVVFDFTIADGKILAVNLIGDPDGIAAIALEILE
jgi:RNA polymerase sigma factor (sigma-70 family)